VSTDAVVPRVATRRAFLRGSLATSVVLLAAACAPSAPPAAPTAAPTVPPPAAAPKPTSPAATAQPVATQAAPAQAAPAAASLKIGVLLPYTKVYAALGESITNGMQLYFDSVNNLAGGRKVELIKEDEENDPQASLRKLRKLVEQDQVELATGIVSSAIALAIRDYVHDNKVLFLISNAGANALTRDRKSPYVFRTAFSNWQPNAPMGDYVYKNVAQKVMIVAADYAAGHEATDAFKETFEKVGGSVVGSVFPPFPNTDYAPFIEQIRQARPPAIYTFFAGSDAVNFVKQFDEFGLSKDIKLLGGGFLVEEDVLPAQGRAAVGVVSGLHYANTLDTPENKAFASAYRQRFNKPADTYATQGYDTARTIVDALGKTQGNTRDKDAVVKALEGLSFASPRGPFTIDPATHNPIHNIYAREVRLVGDQVTNLVLETFKDVRDPG
jgi:branched-chain amino acid transport system substrate-binding protein